MNRLPPSLINLDNAMEDFMAEYKRKTTRIVAHEQLPEELRQGHYWKPVSTEQEMRQLWSDAHLRAHFGTEVMPTETEPRGNTKTHSEPVSAASLKTSGLAEPKPWKLKAAIALGLISWFWFEVAKHLGWIV